MPPDETVSIQIDVDNSRANQSLKATELALRKNARALDDQVRGIRAQIAEMKRSDAPNKEMVRALEAQAAKLKNNASGLRSNIAALRDQAAAAKLSEQSTRGFSKAIESLGASTLGVTGGVLGLVAALGGVVAAVKSFGAFERTLNTVAAVSGATSEELARLKQSSLDLGAATIFSNQDVAESYLGLSKAGLSVQESLAAMPGVLDAAAASGEGLAATSDIVVGTLRGFNLEADKASHVADVLAQAANSSSADISDIGLAFKQIGPTASTASQTMEDMAGIVAALADKMIKGSDAGTDLKAILLRLVAPPTDAAKALSQLGVSASDSTGKVRPLIDIVQDLKKSLSKFDQKTQIKFLTDIAGLENVKSLSALIGLTSEKLQEYVDKANDADGASKRMADTINQGVNTAVQQFAGSAETLTTNIGEALTPAVLDLIKGLTGLINSTNENGKQLIQLIQNVYDAGKAFAELGLSVLFLSDPLDTATGKTDKLKETLANLAFFASSTATVLRGVALDIQESFANINNTILSAGNEVAFAQRDASTKAKFGLANKALQAQQDRKFLGILKGVDPPAVRGAQPKATSVKPFNPFGSGNVGGDRNKKSKAGSNSASQAERKVVSSITSGLSDSRSLLDAKFDLIFSNLGPGITGLVKLKNELLKSKQETNLLNEASEKLKKTQLKTKEGEEQRTDALKKLDIELIRQEAATKNLENALSELFREQRKQQDEFIQGLKESGGQASLEILTSRLEEQKAELKQFYDEDLITAGIYYSELKRISEIRTQEEIRNIDLQIEGVNKKIEALTAEERQGQALLSLQKQEIDLENQRARIREQGRRDQGQITQEEQQEAQKRLKSLQQRFQQSLEQAINSALSGNGLGGGLRSFASSLGNTLKSVISEFLSVQITKVLKPVFEKILNTFTSKISTASQKLQVGGGAALVGIGSAIAGSSRNFAGRAGGFGLSLAGGALAGSAFGPIGTAIGSVIGASSGLFGFLSGSRQRKAAQREAEIQRNVQKFNSIVSSADTNNVNDLLARYAQVNATRSRGRAGRDAKRAAVFQLEDLIRARYQHINQTIDDLRRQNVELDISLQKLNDPFKAAALDRQNALTQLKTDTNLALYNFRDSQAAQTEILKNESLKRQAIEKQAAKTFEDSARSLEDLLKERDAVENSNVFLRAKSRETIKAESLEGLDKEIATALLELNSLTGLGLELPKLAGVNKLIAAAQTAGSNQASVQFIINGATDPNAVSEEVLRQLTGFFRKNLGVSI